MYFDFYLENFLILILLLLNSNIIKAVMHHHFTVWHCLWLRLMFSKISDKNNMSWTNYTIYIMYGILKITSKRWFYSFRKSWCQYIFEAKACLKFQQSVHSVLLNSVEIFNLFVLRLLLQFCIIKHRLKRQCILVITALLRHGPSCSRIVSQSV